jgi:hypothetical protein
MGWVSLHWPFAFYYKRFVSVLSVMCFKEKMKTMPFVLVKIQPKMDEADGRNFLTIKEPFLAIYSHPEIE